MEEQAKGFKIGKGLSAYATLGARKPFHFGLDGPSFRMSLLWLTFCVSWVDIESFVGHVREVEKSCLDSLRETQAGFKDLSEETADMAEQVAKLEAENKTQKRIIDELAAAKVAETSCEEETKTLYEENARLVKENTSLADDNSRMSAECERLKEDKSCLEAEKSDLEDEITRLESDGEDAEKRLAEAAATLDTAVKTLQESSRHLGQG